MPRSNIGNRTGESPQIPDAVRQGYHDVIHAILDEPSAVDDAGNPCAHTLELSSEALADWKHFALRVETDCADGGRYEHIRDWASKFPGAVARIAVLLHVARHAGRGIPQCIETEDMDAALRLSDALAAHTLLAFDAIGADAALEDTRAVMEWVRRECLTSFTRRDVQRAHQSRFKNVAELDGALRELVERGYTRTVMPHPAAPRRGRPSECYEVNPHVAA